MSHTWTKQCNMTLALQCIIGCIVYHITLAFHCFVTVFMYCTASFTCATWLSHIQHTATHFNKLQHPATHVLLDTLQHPAPHCNTLQIHCNTLQHTATHFYLTICQHQQHANHCSLTLWRAFVCSILFDVHVWGRVSLVVWLSLVLKWKMRWVAVCCIVLCCSVLQCVAARCSVLQCVAV